MNKTVQDLKVKTDSIKKTQWGGCVWGETGNEKHRNVDRNFRGKLHPQNTGMKERFSGAKDTME